MRWFTLILGFWIHSILFASTFHLATPANPYNVILLIADDLNSRIGATDPQLQVTESNNSSYPWPRAVTPNIDALLNRGVRFENAHVTFAACAPSRAAMFSGRRNDVLRMWDTRKRYFRERNPDVETLPGVLRKHGYKTVGLGKVMDNRNHVLVNGAPELCTRRNNHYCSWDEYITTDALEDSSIRRCGEQTLIFPPLSAEVERRTHLVYNISAVHVGALHDNCLTKVAISKLEKLADEARPFFLAVGWKLPHMPWVMPEEYLHLYDGLQGVEQDERQIKLFWSNESSVKSRYNNGEIETYDPDGNVSTVERTKGYLAATSFVDSQIGLFVDAFDNLAPSVVDNTMIVFWSDHGLHLGDNGLWGKWTLMEQATKTPMSILPPPRYFDKDGRKVVGGGFGRKVLAPVESIDLLPTVLEMCGVDIPSKVSGASLVPLLFAPSSFVRAAAVSQMWSYDRWHRAMGYSIRTMNHRLVLYTTTFDKGLKGASRLPYGDFTKVKLNEAELYDYTLDGNSERVNRFRDPKYASTASSLIKLWNQTVNRHWTGLIARKPPDHVASSEIDLDDGRDELVESVFVDFIGQFETECTLCAYLSSLQAWEVLVVNVEEALWNVTEPKQINFALKESKACSSTLLEATKAVLQSLLPRHSFDTSCGGVPQHLYISAVQGSTAMPSQQPTSPSSSPSTSPSVLISAQPTTSSTTNHTATLAPSVESTNDGLSVIPVVAGTAVAVIVVLAVVLAWCVYWPCTASGQPEKRRDGKEHCGWLVSVCSIGKVNKAVAKTGSKTSKSEEGGARKESAQPEEHPVDPEAESGSPEGSSNGSSPIVQVSSVGSENYFSLTDGESHGRRDIMEEQREEVFRLARSISKGATPTEENR